LVMALVWGISRGVDLHEAATDPFNLRSNSGIPLAAYAIGVPNKYIQGLFLLLLLIYLVPLALNTYPKRSRQDRDE